MKSKLILGMLMSMLIVTGCATFKDSDLKVLVKDESPSESSKEIAYIMDLPVRIRYFTNYDSGNDDRQSKAHFAIKKQIESYYAEHQRQPVFIENDHEVPAEYVDYYIVADRYDAKLDAEGIVSSILFGITLMILPGNIYDVDYYIRMSHFKDGKLISRNLYMQSMDQYIGLFIAPWSNRAYETVGASSIQEVFPYQYDEED